MISSIQARSFVCEIAYADNGDLNEARLSFLLKKKTTTSMTLPFIEHLLLCFEHGQWNRFGVGGVGI